MATAPLASTTPPRVQPRRVLAAGVIAATVAALLVCAAGLLAAALLHAAHARDGCAAVYNLSPDCFDQQGDNGFLADFTAVVWSSHGVGVVTGLDERAGNPAQPGSGSGQFDAVIDTRLPLGGGTLLVLGALLLGGRVAAAATRLGSAPEEIGGAALVAAAAYPAVMVLVGVGATARGLSGLAVGPDFGQLLLILPLLGLAGAGAGLARQATGLRLAPTIWAWLCRRLGRAAPAVEGAGVGLAAGLAVAAAVAVGGLLADRDRSAEALSSVVQQLTSHPFPDSSLGTAATVLLVALALPTLALWTFCLGLAVPLVSLVGQRERGTSVALGLAHGGHPGWLWLAMAAPLVATLLAGYVAARRIRAATRWRAAGGGALAGVLLAATASLLLAVLGSGISEAVQSQIGATQTRAGLSLPQGPDWTASAAMLLLAGLVGGGAGGWMALALVDRPLGLPVLRRWDAERTGRPVAIPPPSGEPRWASIPAAAPALRFERLAAAPREGDPLAASRRLVSAVRRTQRPATVWIAEVSGDPDELRYLTEALGGTATMTDAGVVEAAARFWQRPRRRAVLTFTGELPDLVTLIEGGGSGGHSLLLLQVPAEAAPQAAAALRGANREAAVATAVSALLHPGGSDTALLGDTAPS